MRQPGAIDLQPQVAVYAQPTFLTICGKRTEGRSYFLSTSYVPGTFHDIPSLHLLTSEGAAGSLAGQAPVT